MLPSRNNDKKEEKSCYLPGTTRKKKKKKCFLPGTARKEEEEEKTCYLPGTTRPPSQFPPPPLLGIIVICFWENGEIYEREEMQSIHWDTIGILIRDGFTLSWGRQCCSCLWCRSNGISQMTARTKHFSHSYGTDIFLVWNVLWYSKNMTCTYQKTDGKIMGGRLDDFTKQKVFAVLIISSLLEERSE